MSIRGIYIIIAAIVSLYVGNKWGMMIKGADDVLSGIVDVFSILAGVLVAVVSIIGDPSMLLPGNWRVGYEHAKDVQDRLARFSHLFTIYILTIFLVLFARLADFSHMTGIDWIFQIVLGLVTFGFLMSLPLPYSLMAIQKERMREEIRRRKERGNG